MHMHITAPLRQNQAFPGHYVKNFLDVATALGNRLASELLSQILHWWKIKGRRTFYKFKCPCEHPLYRPGDSWSEELGLSKYLVTKAEKILIERGLVRKWRGPGNVTYYRVNEEQLSRFLTEIAPEADTAACPAKPEEAGGKASGMGDVDAGSVVEAARMADGRARSGPLFEDADFAACEQQWCEATGDGEAGSQETTEADSEPQGTQPACQPASPARPHASPEEPVCEQAERDREYVYAGLQSLLRELGGGGNAGNSGEPEEPEGRKAVDKSKGSGDTRGELARQEEQDGGDSHGQPGGQEPNPGIGQDIHPYSSPANPLNMGRDRSELPAVPQIDDMQPGPDTSGAAPAPLDLDDDIPGLPTPASPARPQIRIPKTPAQIRAERHRLAVRAAATPQVPARRRIPLPGEAVPEEPDNPEDAPETEARPLVPPAPKGAAQMSMEEYEKLQARPEGSRPVIPVPGYRPPPPPERARPDVSSLLASPEEPEPEPEPEVDHETAPPASREEVPEKPERPLESAGVAGDGGVPDAAPATPASISPPTDAEVQAGWERFCWAYPKEKAVTDRDFVAYRDAVADNGIEAVYRLATGYGYECHRAGVPDRYRKSVLNFFRSGYWKKFSIKRKEVAVTEVERLVLEAVGDAAFQSWYRKLNGEVTDIIDEGDTIKIVPFSPLASRTIVMDHIPKIQRKTSRKIKVVKRHDIEDYRNKVARRGA